VILTENQLEWQEKAREFAEKEIRPISLERDRIADPAETFDWDIIEKGSRLGSRTAVVSKEFGRRRDPRGRGVGGRRCGGGGDGRAVR
jgi:alkylation response protein AidB-like acyl-CoA dehydrogenase